MKGKARAGWGAFIDQSILDHEMSADHKQIAALTFSLAERLRGGSTAHITSEIGTDLRMSLAGREWREDSGILRGQGVFGNLPAGEIMVNCIARAQLPSEKVDTTIDSLVRQAKKRNIPLLWWTGPATRPSDLAEHLEKQWMTVQPQYRFCIWGQASRGSTVLLPFLNRAGKGLGHG